MVTGYLRAALNALRQQFLRAAAKYAMVFRFFCCMLFGVSIFVCSKRACLQQGMEAGAKCIVRAGKQMKLQTGPGHWAEGGCQKPRHDAAYTEQKFSYFFLLIYLLTLHTYTYKTRLSLCRLLFK